MSSKLPVAETKQLPVIALRDVVVYPNMVIPLFVGRAKSINAIEMAMKGNKEVLLIAQKDGEVDDPQEADLFEIGTTANVLQMLKLPDNTVKVLIEGVHRAKATKFEFKKDMIMADLEIIDHGVSDDPAIKALAHSLLASFEQYVKVNKKIPPEVLTAITSIENYGRLADSIASHLNLKLKEKQELLELSNVVERMDKLLALLQSELDVAQMERRIRGRVKTQMEKSQREYYLNEQMKAIQKELGEIDEFPSDLESLEKRIKESGMPEEVMTKAKSEFAKLKMMAPMSAEANVSRNYLDVLLDVPWKKASKINHNLKKAQKILDNEHYGLEKVKERIVEYLAVQQRVEKLKGPILCLVGPPGVGKTSLGESIAHATGRKFLRVALGGVRDEAEIRGHRRTYIGALPGKIIQRMIKAGVKNPLFMLDEIDKMSSDFRGDPASALLEVLDPEQNHAFNDHYLEVDYDLSSTMFIATANTLDIPAALLDRMEVIRLSGYTEDEKINIAERHLIPKELERHGLKKTEIDIPEEVVRDIVRYYTREAGVRNLEREISKICRKVVKTILTTSRKSVKVTSRSLANYLGVHRYSYGIAEDADQIGQVTGLAWTEVGGELLKIEAAVVPGKGKVSTTGQLGDVMKESIHAAMTLARGYYDEIGIPKDFFETHDVHIHVPEGATPKDGPSAGIGMCTALISVLSGIPVRADVAMTGEITLRGEVLPIGGLKEKLLAAHRGSIKTVIIPEENKKDLKEIPENVKKDLEIKSVQWIGDVWRLALKEVPPKLAKKAKQLQPKKTSKKTSTKKARKVKK